MKTVTVANKCTLVQNQVATFLSLVNTGKDQPVKNDFFTANLYCP